MILPSVRLSRAFFLGCIAGAIPGLFFHQSVYPVLDSGQAGRDLGRTIASSVALRIPEFPWGAKNEFAVTNFSPLLNSLGI